ncbi:MAG: ABC transporter, partial [Pseudonocardiaceae bacterium]|nr:ABC transporter [Pseudonocardiaceae bacterium]
VVRERVAAGGAQFALVTDRQQRPLRWVHTRDLGGSSLAGAGVPLGSVVTSQSTLQDALEAILNEGGDAVVTGSRGEYIGTVQLDTVVGKIRELREEHN